ncbi:sensor histidine kinase [Roseateles sp.]|uniref:sensor histidine kinase n=1 Tax=Roseateles sp. TaxID=1971397 RepID=UPI002E0405B7|nr:histidine kinase [Roseateles sp.]HEV6968653.1 histidine kinase [Roseateles sp.]
MHPLLTHRHVLAAYLLTAALAGMALAALPAAQGLASYGWALAWVLPLALLHAVAALPAYYVCRGQPLAVRRWQRALAARAAAVGVLSGTGLAVAAAWNAVGLAAGRSAGLVAMTPPAWALTLALVAGFFVLAVLAHDLLIAVQGAQAATAREVEARLLARDMELQLLRLQIDPHFLFNSLNSISALTHFDPAGARAMAIDLAEFFRQTLALAGRGRIRLEEELGLVRHYLAIEQQRLGDKLDLAIQAPDDSLTALLPPLTLQPLTENALKHGLRPREDGGRLDIEVMARDGWLHLTVRNPVPAQAAAQSGLGHGLRNLRERLAAQYGSRARVHWGPTPAGFAVEITLPLETSEAPP